jgi:hypothetical protein
MDSAVSTFGLPVPTRALWTVLSASVNFLFQPAHYGQWCQHLWPTCSNQDIMDCAVSICGLSAPTSTLWTVLSAPVDFLFQPGHYGLCCQHLWISCSNQDIMDWAVSICVLPVPPDCAVSICGLPLPTRTLWTALSASVDFLFQPGHYGLSYMTQAATFCS